VCSNEKYGVQIMGVKDKIQQQTHINHKRCINKIRSMIQTRDLNE